MTERYRIESKRASGNFGTVHRGWDRVEGRSVAVKVLPDDGRKCTFRKRVRREFKIQKELDHPSLVKIFDFEETDGEARLIMEFVEGQNLGEIIRNGDPMDFESILALALQLFSALDCLHEQGIVHRDIKPDNILMNPGGRVKICDFGLARRRADTRLTSQGELLGTMAYLAPEAVETCTRGDRGDVYAAGLILYQLLTGTYPFPKENLALLLDAILDHDPQPVRELNPKVPSAIADLVDACLEKDPLDRPSSLTALECVLRACEELGVLRSRQLESVAVRANSMTRQTQVLTTPLVASIRAQSTLALWSLIGLCCFLGLGIPH